MNDPLDIAYLAMGADFAWREYVDAHKAHERPEAFEGMGQDSVIAEVIIHATQLREAWDALNDEWAGGVWYYDVSEPLGTWIIRKWIEWGHAPSGEAVNVEIERLIAVAEERHPGPGAPGKITQE